MKVEHFVIESAGRGAEIDLCEEHGHELVALLEQFPKKKRRRRTIELSEIEDIPRKATEGR